jgi:hypothetical protein
VATTCTRTAAANTVEQLVGSVHSEMRQYADAAVSTVLTASAGVVGKLRPLAVDDHREWIVPSSDENDVLKSFNRALWLLSARRQDLDGSPMDNQWLWDEIHRLGADEEDPSQYLERIGNLIAAFIEVSSFFLTGWAQSAGEDAEAIIAVTRRICEETYGNQTAVNEIPPEEQ